MKVKHLCNHHFRHNLGVADIYVLMKEPPWPVVFGGAWFIQGPVLFASSSLLDVEYMEHTPTIKEFDSLYNHMKELAVPVTMMMAASFAVLFFVRRRFNGDAGSKDAGTPILVAYWALKVSNIVISTCSIAVLVGYVGMLVTRSRDDELSLRRYKMLEKELTMGGIQDQWISLSTMLPPQRIELSTSNKELMWPKKVAFGTATPCDEILDPGSLFTKTISPLQADLMTQHVTEKEIKNAFFNIGDSKSPGPDGYSAAFFKEAWDIIGGDLIRAVKEFFCKGQMLKDLNTTSIALLPKVKTPSKVNDYRPISCCNVVYKAISKIITSRIKASLDEVVSSNQSAFIPGRRISDNILLTQELMKNYHVDRGTPRCAFKVDIQKAYDTVDWDFLEVTLICFGFPRKMIKWIMACVTTTSFSININGELHGFFRGKRGLRQGDPLSPYLFTLVMEVLTLMIKRNINRSPGFKFHPKCDKLKIVNICFADDLFIFSHANSASVQIIRDSLEEFKRCSGLVPSLPKSTAFFCNVADPIKSNILMLLPFEEDKLPVRYLGVPLVSSRLMYRDCKILVERVKNKVDNWMNKFLSFAGRVQLITSVLTAMQIYWCSVFILPDMIIKDIEKLLRGFLWCQGPMKRGKAKVKWDDVCLPKDEGGLGIKRLKNWNVALMATHAWHILNMKPSLWVTWIYEYKLANQHFWSVDLKAGASWSWRKILLIRPHIRNFISSQVGDGKLSSAWYDSWCNIGPIANTVSHRDIARAGWHDKTVVRDIMDNVGMKLPSDWYQKYPTLQTLVPPVLSNHPDQYGWSYSQGPLDIFSVHRAWDSLRAHSPKVPWFRVVWFSQCVPRHAFLLWLLMGERLKTQDKLKPWELRDGVVQICSLCKGCPDSHAHLFFNCPFSSTVWLKVQSMLLVPFTSNDWRGLVDMISPQASRNLAQILVSKLCLAATVYTLWQERNVRMFKHVHRTEQQVFEAIVSNTRLKLLTIRFKNSTNVSRMRSMWNLDVV
ncbi:uncharacterized protein [Rutidosis leptorrhynchoides]|uniref:uncharacterized protein n=1 Tax=Rutidosis leptorrhynchoides TaxID=125765 RepID=UPI003A9A4DF2